MTWHPSRRRFSSFRGADLGTHVDPLQGVGPFEIASRDLGVLPWRLQSSRTLSAESKHRLDGFFGDQQSWRAHFDASPAQTGCFASEGSLRDCFPPPASLCCSLAHRLSSVLLARTAAPVFTPRRRRQAARNRLRLPLASHSRDLHRSPRLCNSSPESARSGSRRTTRQCLYADTPKTATTVRWPAERE